MWTRLNGPFDKFEFTIIKKDNEYVVKTLDEDGFEITTIQKKLALMKSFLKHEQNIWAGYTKVITNSHPCRCGRGILKTNIDSVFHT